MRQRRSVLMVLIVALAAAAVAGVAWQSRQVPTSVSAVATSPAPAPPRGAPGEPHREFTADRQLRRIQHKDGSGLSPLEVVSTPQGLVAVQRTFGSDGALLEEKAFLDGSPVPVPR